MRMILIVWILLMFVSCEPHLIKTYNALNTWSIEESMEKELFSHKYDSIYVKINDSIEFSVEGAWCEKTFYRGDLNDLGKFKSDFKNSRSYHIVLIVDKNFKNRYKGFNEYWRFDDLTFINREKKNYLVSYARELVSKRPLNDTIEIKLNYSTPPDNPNEFWKTHELGSFFLHKK